jgi:Fur family peroxide stress response transcriptional regulator
VRSIEALSELTRARGGKLTAQKLAIYRVLADNTSHPTADEVYSEVKQDIPVISLTTVYKTLNELSGLGEIKRFEINGTSHFDPDTRPHAEAICLTCGRIEDMPMDLQSLDLPRGFAVTGVTTSVIGHCKSCGGGSQ